ncbi:MAG TPA: hypothetical protein IAA98_12645 [Candidatus Avipropionibacterium avicola]|uniref:Uncharacterized protein n=1 Tax=Candidatus Avipropionibacterium avicola TaxID=2840701 RepID=A0A9D1KNE0_9ACTN|nr:hypothetical protein [Candidatus Avipropionibacterium avicola]
MAGTENTNEPSALRLQVEQVSRPLLVWLTRLPKMVIPLLTIVVLAVGVLAPLPIGIPALALVLLWMVWLGYLAWPAVTPGGRLLRVATVAILALAIVMRLWPVLMG